MTADEILSTYDLELGTASRADVRRAYAFADEGGTIQTHNAFQLFNEPTYWTCMDLQSALFRLGCCETEEALEERREARAEAACNRQKAIEREQAEQLQWQTNRQKDAKEAAEYAASSAAEEVRLIAKKAWDDHMPAEVHAAVMAVHSANRGHQKTLNRLNQARHQVQLAEGTPRAAEAEAALDRAIRCTDSAKAAAVRAFARQGEMNVLGVRAAASAASDAARLAAIPSAIERAWAACPRGVDADLFAAAMPTALKEYGPRRA